MKSSEFNFDLPPELIAQHPGRQRGHSRLMTLNRTTGERSHRSTVELPEILSSPLFAGPSGEKPLLVFNDTKVRKARLIGTSLDTGAPVDFLLLGTRDWGPGTGENPSDCNRVSDSHHCSSNNVPYSPVPIPCSPTWKVLVQRAKRRKPGSCYVFYDEQGAETARAKIAGKDGEFCFLDFDRVIDDAWLEEYGHIPLPPYIKRKDAPEDAERYQTIYAKETGSAAAPTAGLHFTREILDRIAGAGIASAYITLHVGLGTFLPVRCENIEDHLMHEEQFTITAENAALIERAAVEKRKIIAMGTTSLRALESAWTGNGLRQGWQSTSIFIYPGHEFRAVDALFTNFHTPLSTLLMLVCAFAGRDLVLESYAEAVREGYRFFSYGDAMLVF